MKAATVYTVITATLIVLFGVTLLMGVAARQKQEASITYPKRGGSRIRLQKVKVHMRKIGNTPLEDVQKLRRRAKRKSPPKAKSPPQPPPSSDEDNLEGGEYQQGPPTSSDDEMQATHPRNSPPRLPHTSPTPTKSRTCTNAGKKKYTTASFDETKTRMIANHILKISQVISLPIGLTSSSV
jgi:hypothetical protein